MAEPGDPSSHDHDDLIGFTSPRSLAGSVRAPEPVQAPAGAAPIPHHRDDPTDDLFDDDPAAAPVPVTPEAESVVADADAAPEPPTEPADVDDLGPLFGASAPVTPRMVPDPVPSRPPLAANADFDTPPPPRAESPVPTPHRSIPPVLPVADGVSPLPAWARETPRAARPGSSTFGRAQRAAPPEGAMSLYATYALILFAVPTLGVAAVIALVSVIGRPIPAQDLAASHFIFQKRTLWIAAIGAAVGVVLIAVNVGVFVLVAMALWVIIRGAAGLIRLAAGRPIENPLTWTL